MQNETSYPQLNTIQLVALVVGLVGLLALGVGAALDLKHFFQSYLFGYMFALAPGLGCLIWMMIHHLTGGTWGISIRRMLEAGALSLGLMALLFIPIALSVMGFFGEEAAHALYHWNDPATWADPDAFTFDPIIAFKVPYLNAPFYVVRAVIYFLLWIGLALLYRNWSLQQDKTGNQAFTARMKAISGVGLVIFVLTVTLMSVDWVMSIDVHWFSTMYGVLYIVGQSLFAMALMIVMMAILINYKPFDGLVGTKQVHDLGKFLFALTALWAYVNYGQYIIIWSGDIAEFTPWFVRRANGGWVGFSLALIIFHFFVPFFVLLSRRTKQTIPRLVLVAAFMILMRLLDMAFLVLPEFRETVLGIMWMDLVAPFGFFGIWLALFLWIIKRQPLLPPNDPNTERLLIGGGGHH